MQELEVIFNQIVAQVNLLSSLKTESELHVMNSRFEFYVEKVNDILMEIVNMFQIPNSVIYVGQVQITKNNYVPHIELRKQGSSILFMDFAENNAEDTWRIWLSKITPYEISIYDIGLTFISSFSFIVILTDLIMKFYEKFKRYQRRKRREEKRFAEAESRPTVKQITYQYPVSSSVSSENRMVNTPVHGEIYRETELQPVRIVETKIEPCNACETRRSKVYPGNLPIAKSRNKKRNYGNVPIHRQPSELDLYSY